MAAPASYPLQCGSIHVIMGPMFAGKTSELLRTVAALEAAGRRVAVVKSSKDNRYLAAHLTTHDGLSRPCLTVPALANLPTQHAEAYQRSDAVAIDEAQFFGDLVDFALTAAERDGKQVVLAGLDGDFRRQPFGQVLHMVPMAESVQKLTAKCVFCGKAAPFTLRTVDDRQQEVVGGADKYQPVCRQHFIHC
eukprot:jgi/Astpho2/5064/fgenesh1_pm.00071_%23_11_t